jgi:UPF0755 protein
MRRKRSNNGFWLILALSMVIIGYFWYQNDKYQYFLNTPFDETNTSNISFSIKKGEITTDVANALFEKELILDKNAFKKYVKEQGIDKSIVAGRFILSPSLTIPEIAAVITDRKKSELILTIKEGYTVKDIDKSLQELGVITPGEFENSVKEFDQYEKYSFLKKEKIEKLVFPLEGYLFPDTYYIDSSNYYNENLIQLMLQNFNTKVLKNLEIPSGRDLHEYVIMASILEKEVRTKKDIPIVSGILWKRLDENWLLGADATLLYLKDTREITYQDLQQDNPYNTRKIGGLPPGPISNPGLATITASLNPEGSIYYFYLTKPVSGEVVYAATNDEHNRNKQKYLN